MFWADAKRTRLGGNGAGEFVDLLGVEEMSGVKMGTNGGCSFLALVIFSPSNALFYWILLFFFFVIGGVWNLGVVGCFSVTCLDVWYAWYGRVKWIFIPVFTI